jgi:TPP-dependent pyruvate/acetoin dehydrogenase alpha subunit
MAPNDATFYAQMTLIRQVEQTFFDLYARGLLAGTVHTAIGQEATAAGVVGALDPARDVIFSSHRAHGHFLAFTDDVEGLVAELLGRRTGVAGGVGGTQHLHAPNFYSNGIQGGIVPNAAGAALAEKLGETGAIVAVFLGDGTLGEGVVYETMNLAALWSLPLLFVLEDNGYAQSTPAALARAGSLAARPAAFGIHTCDLSWEAARGDAGIRGPDPAGLDPAGLDPAGPDPADPDPAGLQPVVALTVGEVYAAAAETVAFVRSRRAPAFLALRTYRLAPHSKGDDTRTAAELAAAWAADPLVRLAAALPPETVAALDSAAATRIAAAVEAALATPHQSPAEFAEHARWQPA